MRFMIMIKLRVLNEVPFIMEEQFMHNLNYYIFEDGIINVDR